MFFLHSPSLISCLTLVDGYGFVGNGGLRSAHFFCMWQGASFLSLLKDLLVVLWPYALWTKSADDKLPGVTALKCEFYVTK